MKTLSYIFFLILILSCESQNPEHFADSYSKEVDRSMFAALFPNQHEGSFATSGNTQVLRASCPVVGYDEEYIVVDYNFAETIDIKDVALLNVFMHRKECLDGKCNWKPVLDNYYLPNVYSNKARIRNFFPKGEYRVWYGFYLKKDSLAEFPKFYKTTCYLTID